MKMGFLLNHYVLFGFLVTNTVEMREMDTLKHFTIPKCIMEFEHCQD